MSTIKLECGQIVDRAYALDRFQEDEYFNGHNHCSINTDSQWEHQDLYLSRLGFWYIVQWSQREGTKDKAWKISENEAVEWIALNRCKMPDSLKKLEDELIG
jgi:hypothetical protein